MRSRCSNDDYGKYAQDSAYSSTNLPLIRLEPILRREAETRNPGKVLFNHEVVSFKELDDHVLVEVVDRNTGIKLYDVADYVIAADGGKFFGPALGIKLEGPEHVADTTSVHIKADLSKYWQDGDLMCWLVSPPDYDSPLFTPSGLFGAQWTVVVQMGPTWGKNSEEFVVHLGLGQRHLPLDSLTNEDLKNSVRQSLRIPDLEMEILNTSRWNIQGVYATQYQTKRIFLAGDAVHRHPRGGPQYSNWRCS
jgi:2,4-dichlorophenol 6-monooxygenase